MARTQSVAELFRVAAQSTVDATQRMLVSVAKREHARIMATAPEPKSFTRFVDGRQGAPEEVVKANGVIVYRYPRLEQVVQFAMETLFDLSPVLSGEYRNAHTIFVDGAAVPNLESLKPGHTIVISNPLPYARKIEVGNMKMRVPGSDRVYQQAARKVSARFGNIASVKFNFRGIVAGFAVDQGKAASFGQPWWLGGGQARSATGAGEIAVAKQHGQTAHNRSNVRYPVLEISER